MAGPLHQEIIGEGGPPVRIVIDGRSVQVDPHMTILEAAEANGIEIPTLCHDPRLAPVGRCKLCVVEVTGDGQVQACETPVAEGMEVTTLSPALEEARRSRLTEFLSNHNAYCEPPCHYACPAGIDIPAYLGAIARGDDAEAIQDHQRAAAPAADHRPDLPAAVRRAPVAGLKWMRNRWPSAS